MLYQPLVPFYVCDQYSPGHLPDITAVFSDQTRQIWRVSALALEVLSMRADNLATARKSEPNSRKGCHNMARRKANTGDNTGDPTPQDETPAQATPQGETPTPDATPQGETPATPQATTGETAAQARPLDLLATIRAMATAGDPAAIEYLATRERVLNAAQATRRKTALLEAITRVMILADANGATTDEIMRSVLVSGKIAIRANSNGATRSHLTTTKLTTTTTTGETVIAKLYHVSRTTTFANGTSVSRFLDKFGAWSDSPVALRSRHAIAAVCYREILAHRSPQATIAITSQTLFGVTKANTDELVLKGERVATMQTLGYVVADAGETPIVRSAQD